MAEKKPLAKNNLYQKLVEVRKEVKYLQKDTAGYNFKYVSGATVIGSLRKKMDELGLLLVSSIKEYGYEVVTEKNKKGETSTAYVIQCKMLFTWINAENPEERLDVPYCCFGSQSDVSQALGSALTYSERYFLLKFFNIATDKDDPDARTGDNGGSKVVQKDPQQAKNDDPATKVVETKEMQAKAAEIVDAFKQAKDLMELEEMSNTYRPEINKMSRALINWVKERHATVKSNLSKTKPKPSNF